jgi:hypothetical protein
VTEASGDRPAPAPTAGANAPSVARRLATRLADGSPRLRALFGLPRSPRCWVVAERTCDVWRAARWRLFVARSLAALPANRRWRVSDAGRIATAGPGRAGVEAPPRPGSDLALRAVVSGLGASPGDVLVLLRRSEDGALAAELEPWGRIGSALAMDAAHWLEGGVSLPLAVGARHDPALAAFVLALHGLQRPHVDAEPEARSKDDTAPRTGSRRADLAEIARLSSRASADLGPFSGAPRGRALERLAVWAALPAAIDAGESRSLASLDRRLATLLRGEARAATREPPARVAAILRLSAMARFARARAEPWAASRHLAEALAAAAEARRRLCGVGHGSHLARTASLEGVIAAALAAVTNDPAMVERAEAAHELARALADLDLPSLPLSPA